MVRAEAQSFAEAAQGKKAARTGITRSRKNGGPGAKTFPHLMTRFAHTAWVQEPAVLLNLFATLAFARNPFASSAAPKKLSAQTQMGPALLPAPSSPSPHPADQHSFCSSPFPVALHWHGDLRSSACEALVPSGGWLGSEKLLLPPGGSKAVSIALRKHHLRFAATSLPAPSACFFHLPLRADVQSCISATGLPYQNSVPHSRSCAFLLLVRPTETGRR